MTQPNGPAQVTGSRIAEALHDDAEQAISDRLNLWPGISERLSEKQPAHKGVASPAMRAVSEQQDAWAKTEEPVERKLKKSARWNLSLAGSMPAIGITVAMVLLIIAQYIAPAQPQDHAKPFPKPVDACKLITQEEANSLTGKSMEQYPWKPVRANTYACSYFSEGESINILLADFRSKEEVEEYIKTSVSDSASFQVNKSAEQIESLGDETYTRSRKPGNENIKFWDVIMRQQNRYMIVTWMTGKPDPTAQLQVLASKVIERLNAP